MTADKTVTTTGDLYTEGASVADNARAIRKRLAESAKAGEIPAGAKFSVQSARYFGGARIDITLTALPSGFHVYDEAYVRDVIVAGGRLDGGSVWHADMIALLDSVNGLAMRFSSRTDSVDYVRANFCVIMHTHADVCAAARRAALGAHAAIDCSGMGHV